MYNFAVLKKLCICMVWLCVSSFAQQTCDTAPPTIAPKGSTIFTPEQEGYLGDVIVETMQRQLRTYRQPNLTAPLERIGVRLKQFLPAQAYAFQFALVEIPDVNAFVIPGGRIFVSRRLISFVESEDELAGVIAHEMGHVLARQASVDMTRTFRDELKVTSVGGRDDVFQKFNQLLDQSGRAKRRVSRGEREDDQVVADRVSLEAVWRAGYDPQALARFLDRLTENKGATGNLFSDLFGLTRPESKRIRELLRGTERLPASCRQTRGDEENIAFREWQRTIAGLGREEATVSSSTAVQPSRILNPRLQPETYRIRFSSDGQLLLAQDDSGIDILKREPLQFLFRIPSLDGGPAIFSNDSNQILFQVGSSRMENWDVSKRARASYWEPAGNLRCAEIIPSPDGRTVACMANFFGRDVRLFDLKSNTEIARHMFVLNGPMVNFALLQRNPTAGVRGSFTPDGLTFLATSWLTYPCCEPWAYRLDKRSEISIGRPLRDNLSGVFAFVSTDRVLISNAHAPQESGVFTWPEGKRVSKSLVPVLPMESVTTGNAVILRQYLTFGAAVFDAATMQVAQTSRSRAFDRYGNTLAAERLTGEIALYDIQSGGQPLATVQLPEANLGRLRGAAHSPDLEWIALSGYSRGSVWNLKTGQNALTFPFDGGAISNEGIWTTNMEMREKPENGAEKVIVRRGSFDLRAGKEIASIPTGVNDANHRYYYFGKYELAANLDSSGKNKYSIQVKESSSNQVLWTQDMEDRPQLYVGNAVVVRYDSSDKTVEAIVNANPELKRRLESMPKKSDVAVLDVLALDTGRSLGRALFDDGGRSVGIAGILAADGVLFVQDSFGRTLSYSLETGERVGQQFGRLLAVDYARGRAAVENELGKIAIYDGSMKPVLDLSLPAYVVYAGFDSAGKRLLCVTGSQSVFIFDTP
jgi:hypothetical protein